MNLPSIVDMMLVKKHFDSFKVGCRRANVSFLEDVIISDSNLGVMDVVLLNLDLADNAGISGVFM